jgi:hypothetical protein
VLKTNGDITGLDGDYAITVEVSDGCLSSQSMLTVTVTEPGDYFGQTVIGKFILSKLALTVIH